MFTNLKGKILSNVTKIISGGAEEPPQAPKVDLNAGFPILTHFQKEWAQLHEINEENAANAAKVADVIDRLFAKISKDHSNFVEINNLLSATPFNAIFENSRKQLECLYESFRKTEDALTELENVIEELELKERMANHLQQLEMYRESKSANYEKLKLKLESQYAIEQMDKEKVLLQERQQVFQEAFNNDLQTYKNMGTLPKIEIKVQPSALLEEIEIDLDHEDLERFLEDK